MKTFEEITTSNVETMTPFFPLSRYSKDLEYALLQEVSK
jgi:hypothetical protein